MDAVPDGPVPDDYAARCSRLMFDHYRAHGFTGSPRVLEALLGRPRGRSPTICGDQELPSCHGRTTVSDVEDAVDQILEQWGRERPDLDCSPMGIIGRITQLQREVFLAQRATFSRYGLDAPAFDVLAALRRAGKPYQLTPTALMRTALVTSGAITQRLDRLEEKGLITRERSEADGRAVVVTLTDAGRAALDAALPDHLETERQLLDGLSAGRPRAARRSPPAAPGRARPGARRSSEPLRRRRTSRANPTNRWGWCGLLSRHASAAPPRGLPPPGPRSLSSALCPSA